MSGPGELGHNPKTRMQLASGSAPIFVSVLLIVVGLGFPQEGTPTSEGPPIVAVIPVKGMVDTGLATYMERAIGRARQAGASYMIFEIDTPGGLVDSGTDIHSLLIGITDAKTVAFVTNQALSAGALIALSCNSLVMKKGTRIGDVEPITVTAEGMKELGEKYQTNLRAIFRVNAERNGYPEKLSEAMVTKELEVLRVTLEDGKETYLTSDEFDRLSEEEKKGAKTEVIVREGELLTMTSAEAKELGFADAVVVDRAELLDFYDLGEAKVVEMIPTWSEELARLIQRYGIIFLGLGLLGIYLEIKTPGFGVPGILGISCLVIFFLGKYVVGLAEEVDILLFVIGIALLALEIFVIPGFGVAGILGILFIIAGIYLASVPFWIPRELPDFQRLTTWAWQFSLALGSVVVIGFILARYLPRVGLPGKLMITAQEKVSEGYVAGRREEEGLDGKVGISVTKLRPAGKAEIDDRVLDVVAEGEFIEKGEKVVVVNARGTKVVVRKA